MRVAAVDLGTNSFLCLICDIDANGGLNIISDVCRIVRLGEKVHQNRFFLPEALARAEKVFIEFSELIKAHKVEKVVATATSAARDAANGQELLALGLRYNIPITIIDGDREAQLSFEGALSGIDQIISTNEKVLKKILVIDVGGGSTEMILQEPNTKNVQAHSFDVGCVRLTEMFLRRDPVASNELNELIQFATKTFSDPRFVNSQPDLVIAVAGTPTTLACVVQKLEFDQAKVDGYVFTKLALQDLTLKLSAMPLNERAKVMGLEPMRADVIVAGGALLIAALDVIKASELSVSTRGLRYGVALHYKDFTY
jgi:exopolyphosphatase/guanosine-5'-triphosphate,3'-diphosphate pyrophosphatase